MRRKTDLTFRRKVRSCNICGASFHPRNVFARFCDDCRSGEDYRFSEWLPDPIGKADLSLVSPEPAESLREAALRRTVA
jgi:hypothetical protein